LTNSKEHFESRGAQLPETLDVYVIATRFRSFFVFYHIIDPRQSCKYTSQR